MTYGDYHHGDAALNDTIIKMAANFPTSNNINYLYPMSNFGNI